jgi:hypothetical protein
MICLAIEKLNKIMYIKVPRIVPGIWHAQKQFQATVFHILTLDTDLSFFLKNIFHLSGFLPIFIFMTAPCLCQASAYGLQNSVPWKLEKLLSISSVLETSHFTLVSQGALTDAC